MTDRLIDILYKVRYIDGVIVTVETDGLAAVRMPVSDGLAAACVVGAEALLLKTTSLSGCDPVMFEVDTKWGD